MVNIVGRYEYSKRARPQVKCDPKTKEGKSRTIQSASEETNINKIMERYEKTGCLYDPLTGVGKQPMFGDVTGIGDYKEVLTRIIDLEDRFMCLPAKVRQRFSNDPFELVSFIENEQNRQEAVDLGLIEGRPAFKAGTGTPAEAGVSAGNGSENNGAPA